MNAGVARKTKHRYAITYMDSSHPPRRRWLTIGDNLDHAQAALDDIVGRKRRGERILAGRRSAGNASNARLIRGMLVLLAVMTVPLGRGSRQDA